MADKYSVTQYSVSTLLGYIEAGDIAIPEIQRPFVWKGRQVRDLIDSLYHGYPTGYLIIWQNPDVRLKNGDNAVGKKVLIDGQQRVTALMTAVAGHAILTEDYEEKVVRIAFNPLIDEESERFAVQTPVHLNSKEWIADISELFKPEFSQMRFLIKYLQDNPGANAERVEKRVLQLIGIKNCQLGAIMLVPDLDLNEVTEIFVRINSQGKRLNEADFAMSKIAADEKYGGHLLRKAIDYFCHLSIEPAFYQKISTHDAEFMASDYASKVSWLKDDTDAIYDPSYSDMLRVSFMHQFRRGKLGDLVSLLSGRDFKDRTFKEEIAEDCFKKMRIGVLNFMNEYNFKQFVLAIRSAGFIATRLLNSQITLDFAYTLYLLLHERSEISSAQLKNCIQKWFVLSTLTGRYIGSPESQMDKDLRGIEEKGFFVFLKENEEASLSEGFWDIRLVQSLETSSISSPYFLTYLAAQIFNGDKSLLSNSTRVSDLIVVSGDVHHIFPKEYLKKSGIKDKALYNQVANYAYLDTNVNISIGDRAPHDYFGEAFAQCGGVERRVGTILDSEELLNNLRANAIPEDICTMSAENYFSFLHQRRVLMAQKIKSYYYGL
ncbi:GmrSD restriction endonuclease domain-containing protein [Mailhella sp.]|uniref:GmrSD restriction endonuclease domain-containing protein n=1 Tax=Mailhella sp. TaxID=1981029 RepID=UPI003AB7B01E